VVIGFIRLVVSTKIIEYTGINTGFKSGGIMAQNEHDPFEDHINSESFDVSHLDNAVPPSEMDLEMQAFFDNLPTALNHELWDTELDERQKIISAHLTSELVERVMRENHPELLQDINDAELIALLSVPITIAMIAEQRLHQSRQEAPEFISSQAKSDFLAPSILPSPAASVNFRQFFSQAKDFFIKLFRRT
jgi:hypothetical protein